MTAANRSPSRVSLMALVLATVVLPFELRTPVMSAGPVALTNVELVLYVGVTVALLASLRRPAELSVGVTPLHAAVLLWVVVMAVSAIAAPEQKAAAVKFTLRTAAACLLFFATAAAIRTPERASVLVLALTAGATLSALVGILEAAVEGFRDRLMAFREQHSMVGGAYRSSGTFDYANTATMYWEAVLPLAIAAAVWSARRGASRGERLAYTLAAMLIALAVVLTLSRAGLAVTGLSLAALLSAGVVLRMKPLLMRTALVLIVVVAAVAVLPAVGGLIQLRFRSNHLPDWYRPVYRVDPARASVAAGAALGFDVWIRNDGFVAWKSSGDEAVAVSHFWKRTDPDAQAVFSGERLLLPRPVAPGEEITLRTLVRVPTAPGAYELHFDLLIEKVVWFSALGAATGVVPVEVTKTLAAAPPAPVSMDAIAIPPPRAERRRLWAAAVEMWRQHPWLGIGPDNFRHLHGRYLGSGYRDSRTHANSLYFETLATLGAAGVVVLLVIVAALGTAAAQAWRHAAGADARVIVAALTVSIAAFFVHGLLDYFFIFTPTSALFWTACGMLAGLSRAAAA